MSLVERVVGSTEQIAELEAKLKEIDIAHNANHEKVTSLSSLLRGVYLMTGVVIGKNELRALAANIEYIDETYSAQLAALQAEAALNVLPVDLSKVN